MNKIQIRKFKTQEIKIKKGMETNPEIISKRPLRDAGQSEVSVTGGGEKIKPSKKWSKPEITIYGCADERI